jgi:hypothetical protein
MKKIFLSLIVVLFAVSASAYKNSKRSIDESFMVQTLWGVYTKSYSDDGLCLLPASFPCKYIVTVPGKINIPNQSFYSIDDINTYVWNGWLWMPEGTDNYIYLDIIE